MRIGAAISTLILGITGGAALAGSGATAIPVADFERSAATAQGGLFFSFGGRPDKVNDAMGDAGEPPRGCWRINVTADAPAKGAGGFIPVFDNRGGHRDRDLLDVTSAAHLHISLIGDLGSRTLKIDLVPGIVTAAERWGATAAVLTAADLNATKWARKSVSIDLDGLDKTQLGSIRLLLEGEGPAWLAVADAWFGPADGTPPTPPGTAGADQTLRKAMWVWNTREILPDAQQAAELLRFCDSHGVTDLYLQIPYAYTDDTVRLEMPDVLRSFNVSAHAAGITVHALDGRAEFVLRENHPRMFSLVDALAEFNRAGPPEGRYPALHLDNEPYVMDGWRDPATRATLIRDYVALNEELGRRVRDAGMAFGVDIPFWWDEVEAFGAAVFRARTQSGEKSLLEAVFACVDNAGIMSYRERATGPNGVIGCCTTEFELGAKMGVEVFASVELGTGPRVEKGITFGVFPMSYFRSQLRTLERGLAGMPGCAGIAIHYYREYKDLEDQEKAGKSQAQASPEGASFNSPGLPARNRKPSPEEAKCQFVAFSRLLHPTCRPYRAPDDWTCPFTQGVALGCSDFAPSGLLRESGNYCTPPGLRESGDLRTPSGLRKPNSSAMNRWRHCHE